MDVRRSLYVTTPLLVIGIALLLLPIKVPYSIDVLGKIMPLKEWVLVRGPDGYLISTLYDHMQGSIESYAVRHVERGDHVTFKLHPAMVAGASVAAGDTVGLIYSNEVERQWAELRGELATEMASLRLNRTGQKESVIREAQLCLIHAKEQAEQQRKEVARLQPLFDKKLISEADFEIAETTLRLYEIQMDIAEAQLQTVQTGVREEQMDWVRSRIGALQEEIEILEKRLSASTLTAPIAGRVVRFFLGDTLAVVQDTTSYVVVLPMKWKDRNHIALKQQVELKIDGVFDGLTGTIEQVGNTAQVLNGEQVFGVKAIIEDEKMNLASGLIARCSISCAPVRPYEYLRRFFTQ